MRSTPPPLPAATNRTLAASGLLMRWQRCSGFAYGRMWARLEFPACEEKPKDDSGVMNVRFQPISRGLSTSWTPMNLVEEYQTLHAQRSTRMALNKGSSAVQERENSDELAQFCCLLEVRAKLVKSGQCVHSVDLLRRPQLMNTL
jgi:hypothetical protein